RAPRDLKPPGRNQRGLAESYLILKSEVAERFLHSGTAKTAVPPVEMTSFRWWRTWKKPNFAEVSLFARRKDGPGGGSRTHTGSDPRQILSLLRLPVPPLRENYTENSMSGVWGKGAAWKRGQFGVWELATAFAVGTLRSSDRLGGVVASGKAAARRRTPKKEEPKTQTHSVPRAPGTILMLSRPLGTLSS